MRDTEADYTDDLGELDGIGDRPLPDFLPPPVQLNEREDTVDVISERIVLKGGLLSKFQQETGSERASPESWRPKFPSITYCVAMYQAAS